MYMIASLIGHRQSWIEIDMYVMRLISGQVQPTSIPLNVLCIARCPHVLAKAAWMQTGVSHISVEVSCSIGNDRPNLVVATDGMISRGVLTPASSMAKLTWYLTLW